jgi:hypothetical protein
MLQNLKDFTGSAVPIRVGGTTANHGIWKPNQKEAIIQNFAVAGADQPANVTWGPTYLESFKIFPNSTRYTVGVTFGSGSEGEEASISEARAFYDGIGSDLYAMEVGNEFDGMCSKSLRSHKLTCASSVFPVDRDNKTWSIGEYVPEWLNRTAAIATKVLSQSSQRLFQAGAFVAPGTVSGDLTWTAQAAIDLGIASTNRARTFCTHQYFGAACGPVKPTMAGNLMNRTAMVALMEYHASASAYSVSKDLPYVIGETNSIACQGLAGVSDVFGAAVWSVDYALYAASLNVSALYWHIGTGYRYSAWQATQNGTTAPGPRPLYYGNWLVAAALGDGDKQVVPIVNTTSLAGYAIYAKRQHLRSIVLVNQEIFNSSTTAADQRPTVAFRLPEELCAKASVQRLTAAGAEVREGINFAGRTVLLNGTIEGTNDRERVQHGIVNVKATEAVVISWE